MATVDFCIQYCYVIVSSNNYKSLVFPRYFGGTVLPSDETMANIPASIINIAIVPVMRAISVPSVFCRCVLINVFVALHYFSSI